jgi:guanosine-3',5'-bis(diphosphate) 3'-pyrophosphohydrolase
MSSRLLTALAFAADRHRHQRRKDREASPYVNHLIAVAEVLADVGSVTDEDLLIAAVLHDVVEDTRTSLAEVETRFGARVAGWVAEVSDDKSRPSAERKRLQIEHAPSLSPGAKQLKIADKICNVRDMTTSPPREWPPERVRAYIAWSIQVVAGCRGINPALDRIFDQVVSTDNPDDP